MEENPAQTPAAQPPSPANTFVLPETTILAAIGCFDLLTSVYFLGTHEAREANPLFALMLGYFGPWGFVAVKALLLAGPLAIAEYARRRSPLFVRNALRVAIVLYVAALAIAYIRGEEMRHRPQPDTARQPSSVHLAAVTAGDAPYR